MGFFRRLLRLEPPRPTALELAEANKMRLKNAKEVAARERQRLIVHWLRRQAELNSSLAGDEQRANTLLAAAQFIEDGEPLKATPPERPHPHSRR